MFKISMACRVLLVGLSLAVQVMAAQAQPLPDGTLRIVVGFQAGGSSDRMARIVADKLKDKLGVPVIVENKLGAGSRIAAQAVKNTPTGQNVLILANPAGMVIGPLLYKDAGYDPITDFTAVSTVNLFDMALAVSTAVPVRELSQLMAWIQANPQKANFGVPAPGSLPYFFALMLGEAAKIQPLVVPYNGSAPLLNDLLGGQIPLALDSPDSVEPYHRAGKLRILAVSSAKRLSFLPDVPTFQELGVNIVATAWNAFFAPKSMPLGKVDRISNAIQEVMKDPDTQKRFTDANLVPVVSNRAQTEAMVQAFREQWTPVIQNSGYKP